MAALYVLWAVVASALLPSAIYPFDPTPGAVPELRAQQIARADGPPLDLYVAEAAPGAPVVLYFMGNAGSLRYFGGVLSAHLEAGRSIVAMTYRGGGGAPGRPSEAALKSDALRAHDALAQVLPGHGAVVVEGFSLGTGLALHVAARRPVDAVVLTASYGRLCRLMARQALLPACAMPWIDRWRADRDVRDVAAPVLILHGTADRLIPLAEGARLFEAFETAAPGRARLVEVEGAGHNDITASPAYRTEIDAALAALP